MQYLSYEEYMEFDDSLPEADFIRYEFRCRKWLDKLTDSRITRMSEVPEAVKMCMVTLVMTHAQNSVSGADDHQLTGFNTDGYSESYAVRGSADAENELRCIAVDMLHGEVDDEGVPLLYRGVR